MKRPGSKAEARRRKSAVRIAAALAALLLAAVPLWAITNAVPHDDRLALQPPHAELPPSFAEQYAVWIAVGALSLVVLVIALWHAFRPGPPPPTPIEVQVRQELEALQRQAEDGRVLSQVSRSLRRYLTGAFDLPPEELTTAEFVRLLGASEKVGAELAANVTDFLRRCDESKFAPAVPAPGSAAGRALELVNAGEARRTQLRAATAAAA